MIVRIYKADGTIHDFATVDGDVIMLSLDNQPRLGLDEKAGIVESIDKFFSTFPGYMDAPLAQAMIDEFVKHVEDKEKKWETIMREIAEKKE